MRGIQAVSESIVTELFEIRKRYMLRHYEAESPSRKLESCREN
jgi:hypothetical protein